MPFSDSVDGSLADPASFVCVSGIEIAVVKQSMNVHRNLGINAEVRGLGQRKNLEMPILEKRAEIAFSTTPYAYVSFLL